STALAATPPDQSQVIAALTALDAEQQRFLDSAGTSNGAPVAASGSTTQSPAAATGARPTVATLLDELSDAQGALARGDYAAAAARPRPFASTWLDVEGEIKTRSADASRQTETHMALAASLASQGSPDTQAVVDRMATRLAPYRDAG